MIADSAHQYFMTAIFLPIDYDEQIYSNILKFLYKYFIFLLIKILCCTQIVTKSAIWIKIDLSEAERV
jgi:hypothetical protein